MRPRRTRSHGSSYGWPDSASLLTCAGFTPTYWGPLATASLGEFSPAVHIHGALFFFWPLLVVMQSWLVARGRMRDPGRLHPVRLEEYTSATPCNGRFRRSAIGVPGPSVLPSRNGMVANYLRRAAAPRLVIALMRPAADVYFWVGRWLHLALGRADALAARFSDGHCS
jgi:hypothetical protein